MDAVGWGVRADGLWGDRVASGLIGYLKRAEAEGNGRRDRVLGLGWFEDAADDPQQVELAGGGAADLRQLATGGLRNRGRGNGGSEMFLKGGFQAR